ncbi:MAG TPA: PilN domain-containing protein [Patescibacteria group bacterium]
MASPITINLVKNRKPKLLDQFIGWSVTIGRVVIVLTEALALGAFLYRFNLDRQLIDLHDKIVQEQNIVNFFKKNEDTYRNLQDRLTLAKAAIQNENQTIKTYTDIIDLVPSDVSITSITYNSANIRIQTQAQSITSISKFVDQLKQYPQVTSVSIDNIENKTSTGTITVGITAILKQNPSIINQAASQ